MKFKETKIAAILVVVYVLVGSVYAADLTVPHIFYPGTAAKSSEVNENFTTIYNAVTALQGQIDTLAGVGWSPGQRQVTCYLFNTGPGNVNITSKAIIPELGGSTYQLSGSCDTPLAAGRICSFSASVSEAGANACYAVLSPSGVNVRGEMEVRDSSQRILNSIVLR